MEKATTASGSQDKWLIDAVADSRDNMHHAFNTIKKNIQQSKIKTKQYNITSYKKLSCQSSNHW